MKLTGRSTAQATAWGLASLVLGGCMSTTPKWDRHFGESLHRITAGQILHPVATQAGEHPDSMDAAAAVRAQDQYLHSFEAPPQVKDTSNTR